jgi:hypothetical protein
LKIATIQQLHSAKHEVGVEIIRHHLETSAQPTRLRLLSSMRSSSRGHDWLANLPRGHGTARGWEPLDDLVAR